MAEEPITEKPKKVVVKEPGHRIWFYIIYFIGGLIEMLLLFRLVFKLSGADSSSGFVSFIYAMTNFLVAPYANFVFEPGTLIAMAVYAFLFWVIVKIIMFVAGRSHDVK